MPNLSREQFKHLAERLNAPNGGFSINTVTGEEPTDGYMVSQSGTEGTIEGKADHQHLEDYATVHSHTLEHPSGTRYFGGWHNMDNHHKVLNVSRNFADKNEATREMLRQDEDAMYDVKKNDEVPNYLKRIANTTPFNKWIHEKMRSNLPPASH